MADINSLLHQVPSQCRMLPLPSSSVQNRVPRTIVMKRPHVELDEDFESDDEAPLSAGSNVTTASMLQLKRLRDTVSPGQQPSETVCVVTRAEMMSYFALLEDPYVYEFLLSDVCLLYSDKYLLAMVFAYFKRGNLSENEYTRMNFFTALFLANDMEEDEEDYKYEILPWALNPNWRHKMTSFLQQRDRLWARIGYRAVVSNRCCEEVISMEPNHWAWKRQRQPHHVGAIRSYARDPDFYDFRGPDDSPREPCDQCAAAAAANHNESQQSDLSWHLSSSSSSQSSLSEDELVPQLTQDGKLSVWSRANEHWFNMEDLKHTLNERKKQMAAEP